MDRRKLETQEDLENMVLQYGFLPFFANEIEGFSVEEHTPRRLWFTDNPGPWEWKGPVAVKGNIVYGKFFRNKAGFVSMEWFPDFANYRRDGYDLDALFDEGRLASKDRNLYDVLVKHHALTTPELKGLCGYGPDGLKGFDTVITRLQMLTYVNIRNFVYNVDKEGNFYGWGISQYTTPEDQFGRTAVRKAYRRDPLRSRERIIRHLKEMLPDTEEKDIRRLIG